MIINSQRVLCRVLLAMAVFAANTAEAQRTEQIQLSELEDMFANIRAKAKWDIDGPLLWGYFFVDGSQAKLKKAATELAATGYRIVKIESVRGRRLFMLRVEKVEVHSPASLHKRNTEFYDFAEKHSLSYYDGMDVGPSGGAPR